MNDKATSSSSEWMLNVAAITAEYMFDDLVVVTCARLGLKRHVPPCCLNT